MTYPNDQNPTNGAIPVFQVPYSSTPLGYQQITSLTSATGLTPPIGATLAMITVSGTAVRYRDDGTAPTSALGMPVAVGATLNYSGNLSAVKFIQQSASATLDILYYK